MKKRVYWLDLIKYICMMIVMYNHTDFNTPVAMAFYYNFVLLGFFFASGYVHKNKDNFKDFMVKKFKSLMIPWFTFGLLNIAIGQVISFKEHNSLIEELKYMFLQIRGLNDKMWFLAALFVAFIPFYFFIDVYEKSDRGTKATAILIIVSLGLSVLSRIYTLVVDPEVFPWKTNTLPWHIEYIFVAMFWLVMGYLFKQRYEETYDAKIGNVLKLLIVLIYTAWVFAPSILGLSVGQGAIYLIHLYVAEFLGVLGVVSVAKMIKPNKYFLYIGQNTLICFGVHGKTFSVLQKIMQKVSPALYKWALAVPWHAILVGTIFTIILSFVLIIPIYIINRWLPFMMGKPMKVAKNNK
jgi:fucose 4-O-acetylase-like acetyltransferase